MSVRAWARSETQNASHVVGLRERPRPNPARDDGSFPSPRTQTHRDRHEHPASPGFGLACDVAADFVALYLTLLDGTESPQGELWQCLLEDYDDDC